MVEVTARPDRLERFTDTLIVHDAELAVSARSLWDTLTIYRSTNGDFGHDHRALADGLAAMSRHLVELDEHVGATAAAFRAVDDGGGQVTASAAAVDRHYAGVVGPITDLRQRMVAISEQQWWTLLYGTWACPPWLAGTYRGGGALRGPDG